jgi:predicted dehydrogenase
MNTPINRRSFIRNTSVLATTLAMPTILPRNVFGANEKLNIATIGAMGKGQSDTHNVADLHNIVALVDADMNRAEGAAKALQSFYTDRKSDTKVNAKLYTDFRKMFDAQHSGIDAVIVSTPDHTHFPAAMWAVRHKKHVAVQKPMCNYIGEIRSLHKAAKAAGLVTQMGNQGRTMNGQREVKEWIEQGAIGTLKEIRLWTNRPIWPQGPGLSFPAQPVPADLNWDVWQGTCATERPFHPDIHPFKWRGFWDYGCGALGDIGCHSFNSAFWALDLNGDFTVESSKVSEFDETMAPKRSTIIYDFPAKAGRAAVKVIWQDGVADPNKDPEFVRPPGIPADLELATDFGQVFVGTEGTIFVNDAYCGTSPTLFPETLRDKARLIKPVYARVKGGPTQELCRAIRGDGPAPISNFTDHAGPLTEMVLVGNLAVRIGKRIDWDSAKLEARGLPEVASMLKRSYRTGWEPKLT